MYGAAELSELNIILVDKAEVPCYIWLGGIGIHVRGCGEGGQFSPHKPSLEGAYLVKGQPMGFSQDIFIIADFCIPVVDADNFL